ncbi:MAG TPA: flagellar biosynthesis protein FlgA [bacterium]|nr:flagellar biosynthesis protein FlgA [bacterium]
MLRERLDAREEAGTPVRVGVIGAGRFGTMVICQLAAMRGMRPSVVADLDGARGMQALVHAGFPVDAVVQADAVGRVDAAIARGAPALTEDPEVLLRSAVDVVVEATGVPEVAARSATEAFRRGKHVVMVSVEADVLVGSVLRRMADQAGVVFSAAYGDQPALIHELVEWARVLGFQVVAAGKGTKYLPEYRKGTPDDIWERYGADPARREGLNPQMYNSFTDGTKSAIEMAAVANMTGLRPDVRGMHFPPAGIAELAEVLKPREAGGVLHRSGVVEVVSSLDRDGRPVPNDLRWGVYVVITSPQPYLRRCFAEYGMPVDRTGAYAAMYRPYHLVGMELPISIARAALDRRATGAPLPVPVAAVVCAAKRPLASGEVLDGEGGYTVYGIIDDAASAWRERLLPMGLSRGARVVHPVAEDGLVRLDDVAVDTSSALYALWEQQTHLLSR